jgi:predicted PurR-regulated permease PerM
MDPGDRWLGAALRAALLVLFLWMIQSVLIPVALAAVFALILSPLQRRLRPHLGRRRGLAPLLLTLGAVVLGVIPFAVLALRLVILLNAFLSGGAQQILDAVQRFGAARLDWLADELGLGQEPLRARFGELLQRAGVHVAGLVGGFAQALPDRLVAAFLFTVALYYFLRDGRRLTRFLVGIAPFRAPDKDALVASLEATVHGAIVGQLVTSAVQGGLTLAALLLFGVPGAVVLGILATLLSVIPMLGTTPVTLGAVLYLVAVGRYGAAVGMAVAAVLIGVSDNVARPWVQSAQGRLHPLLVLVSIFGGIAALGAAGVFLGPVAAALAVWVLEAHTEAAPGPDAR